MDVLKALSPYTSTAIALVVLALTITTKHAPRRLIKNERVVILGASSGIGEKLAYAYASQGARVCLVARREAELSTVAAKCRALAANEVVTVVGDVTSPEDLVRIREATVNAWGGLDTLHIISGLPSIQPILDIATSAKGDLPDVAGLSKLRDEARRCADVNFTGVTLAIAAFVDLLSQTSKQPVIHHLSSVAALVPAPTRAIYGATKAAGLNVLMAAKMECYSKGVRFLAILPGTVDTGFREKLAASGPTIDPAKDSFKKLKLTPDAVVAKILHHSALLASTATSVKLPGPFGLHLRIPGLASSPKALVWLPEFPYRLAHWVIDTPLGWIVERGARKKYGYQ